jgi:hypothetical protein
MQESTKRQEKIYLGKTSSKLSDIVNNAKIGNTSKNKDEDFEIRFFNESFGILYIYIINKSVLNENQFEHLNSLIEQKEKIVNS